MHTRTHTSVLRPSGLCPGLTGRVGTRTNLDFTEARDSEWQWQQLGHMQICTSPQTDNHTSNPPLSFLQAGYPSCRLTNSVKTLEDNQTTNYSENYHMHSTNLQDLDYLQLTCRCSATIIDSDSFSSLHNTEYWHQYTITHTQPFYSSLDFVGDNMGELVPENTFRHLLDFLVQNKDNTGRRTSNLDGLPPIHTNWCPHLCHPHHFYAGCPSWHNPPNLSWLGTGIKYAGLHTRWLG